MNTYFIVLVSKRIECNFTIGVISLRLKNRTVLIFQDEAELTSFEGTSCKSLTEVKLRCYWCYRIVVKFAISWHCDIGCQDTCCRILSDINSHSSVHCIVIDIGICSSFFTNCISMSSFCCIWNGVKLDRSVSFILLRLDDIAIFKQFKGEGISFKRFSFQFLSETELCCSCTRCEGIIELCICWKGFGCCKGMTCFRYSHCHLCLHWIISYPSKWTLNLTYDVLMRSFLTILEGKSIKFHKSIGIICLRLKNFSVWICWSIAWVYQLKAKFTSIQLTTCKSFSEVKLCSDRSNNVIIESCIICTCCFTTCCSHLCFGS